MADFPYKLYLVTDEKACLGRDFFWVVEQAVLGGVDLVQLREKDLPYAEFLEKAFRLKELLDQYAVPLIINDNLSIAKEVGAFGIHVGVNDLSPIKIRKQWPDVGLLGYSIEEEAQIHSNDAAVSDYWALSPIYATPTKTDTVTEWKEEGVGNIALKTEKPLVAIGGINKNNISSIRQAGASGVAVVSAICSAQDPRRAAEELKTLVISVK